MIYECDQCSATLPAGAAACPKCGEAFEEAVPADAVMPLRGFSASSLSESESLQAFSTPVALVETSHLSDEDIISLKSQILILKSAVTTLTNRVKVLEMAGREDKRRFKDHVKHVREALQQLQGSKA